MTNDWDLSHRLGILVVGGPMNKTPKSRDLPLRIAAIFLMMLVFLFFSLVGAALLNLFGGHYQSKLGLVLFFGMTMLVALPLDPLTRRVEKRYLQDPRLRWQLIYLLLDTGLTTFSIRLVDHFDGTVMISGLTAAIAGLFFAMLNLLLIKRDHLL